MNIYKVKTNVDDGTRKFTKILPVFADSPDEACKAVESYYNKQYDTVAHAVQARIVEPSSGMIILSDKWD